MEPGDQFFFSHSSCKVPGIAGVAEIVGPAYTDPTQFDPDSHYFDPDSKAAKPRWLSRDVRLSSGSPRCSVCRICASTAKHSVPSAPAVQPAECDPVSEALNLARLAGHSSWGRWFWESEGYGESS